MNQNIELAVSGLLLLLNDAQGEIAVEFRDIVHVVERLLKPERPSRVAARGWCDWDVVKTEIERSGWIGTKVNEGAFDAKFEEEGKRTKSSRARTIKANVVRDVAADDPVVDQYPIYRLRLTGDSRSDADWVLKCRPNAHHRAVGFVLVPHNVQSLFVNLHLKGRQQDADTRHDNTQGLIKDRSASGNIKLDPPEALQIPDLESTSSKRG